MSKESMTTRNRNVHRALFSVALLSFISTHSGAFSPQCAIGRYEREKIFRPKLVTSTLGAKKPSSDRSNSGGGGHTIEVIDDGRTSRIAVRHGESILSALERNGMALSLSPQSECRRGNCLTCVARHADGSSGGASLRLGGNDGQGHDGLSPNISNEVRGKGYVLTCSSYVVSEGLRIELGANNIAWEEMYAERPASTEAERIGIEVSFTQEKAL